MTKTEHAVRVLRERIGAGAYAPGDPVRVDAVAAELEMSQTPIREALRLLQADGLVEHRPHRGAIVAERSVADERDTAELRMMLEPLAVERAVPLLTSDDLHELRRLHEVHASAPAARGGLESVDVNEAWHWLLYEASGSVVLTDLVRRLWDRYPWRTMWALPGRLERSIEEHAAIMDAVERRDAGAAAARMRDHLESSRRSVFGDVERAASPLGDDRRLRALRQVPIDHHR